jgi:hypothetical protein
MSEYKRIKVRPRKKISSIFKGMSFHHKHKGQKPSDIIAPERTADIKQQDDKIPNEGLDQIDRMKI